MEQQEFDIVADIGGTNARFACIESGAHATQLLNIKVFHCEDFSNLFDVFEDYLQHLNSSHHLHRSNAGLVNTAVSNLLNGPIKIKRVCLAIAAPIENDLVDLPNNSWCFSKLDYEKKLKKNYSASLMIINDFTAQILAIECMSSQELVAVKAARPVNIEIHRVSDVEVERSPESNVIAAIGAGTGLGVSARLPSGEILPSEGGHIAFAPANEHEIDLLRLLWQRFERVSAERLLSGLGLENLYWANSVLTGNEQELKAEEISAGAFNGDAGCLATVADFGNILGAVAGDVALLTGARGGVFITGGIVPKLLPLLDLGLIRRCFDTKGRYAAYCTTIPLFVVLAEHAGLRGCVEALNLNTAVERSI